jgi:hypothetical protein
VATTPYFRALEAEGCEFASPYLHALSAERRELEWAHGAAEPDDQEAVDLGPYYRALIAGWQSDVAHADACRWREDYREPQCHRIAGLVQKWNRPQIPPRCEISLSLSLSGGMSE